MRSPRSTRWLLVALAAAVGACPAVGFAQLRTSSASPRPDASGSSYPSLPSEVTHRFRVGVIVKAEQGAVRDIRAMVAVPIECAEQSVRLLKEEVTPHVDAVEYRELAGGGAKQMLVSVPHLPNDKEARALVTFEVTTRATPPPEDDELDAFRVPRRVPRGLRAFVGVSPFIESKSARIKRLARSIEEEVEQRTDDKATDWDRVEAIYDHVMDEIEYLEGPDTSALDTLKEGVADCHGRSALFVALCRASGVPARMVWVHNHCYPEFYLMRETPAGDAEGVWLPAESAGTRAFGEMPIARTIMQKGDDFRMPERPRERMRYATDHLEAWSVTRGGGEPSVRYVREVLQ